MSHFLLLLERRKEEEKYIDRYIIWAYTRLSHWKWNRKGV
jgi:hypothetical protein